MIPRPYRSFLVVALYLVGAALAIGVPEYYIVEAAWYTRSHEALVPRMYVCALLTCWTLAFLPWVVCVHRYEEDWSPRALCLPVLLTLVGAILVKPPVTQDVLLYVGQGRQIFALGVSPYLAPFAESLHDPIISQINKTWVFQTSHYGPLALVVFTLVNVIGYKAGLLGMAMIMKAVWLVPYGALAVGFWRRWSSESGGKAAVLFFFANPLMIFLIFVEGHVDIVQLALLFYAIEALEKEDVVQSVCLFSAAILTKFTAVILVPVAACYLFGKNKRSGAEFFFFVLLCCSLVYLFLDGAEVGSIIELTKGQLPVDNSGFFPYALALADMKNLVLLRDLNSAVFLVLTGPLCFALMYGRTTRSPFFAMSYTGAILMFTRQYTQPWYTLFYWPFLWLDTRRPRNRLAGIGLWTVAMLALHTYQRFTPPFAPFVFFMANLLLVLRERPEDSKDDTSMPLRYRVLSGLLLAVLLAYPLYKHSSVSQGDVRAGEIRSELPCPSCQGAGCADCGGTGTREFLIPGPNRPIQTTLTFLDGWGRPVEGIVIGIETAEKGYIFRDVTDSSGSVTTDLVAGTYVVTAMGANRGIKKQIQLDSKRALIPANIPDAKPAVRLAIPLR